MAIVRALRNILVAASFAAFDARLSVYINYFISYYDFDSRSRTYTAYTDKPFSLRLLSKDVNGKWRNSLAVRLQKQTNIFTVYT